MMVLGQQGPSISNDPYTFGFDIWVQGKWIQVDDQTRPTEIGLPHTGFDFHPMPVAEP